jgi:hypothetical protein
MKQDKQTQTAQTAQTSQTAASAENGQAAQAQDAREDVIPTCPNPNPNPNPTRLSSSRLVDGAEGREAGMHELKDMQAIYRSL